MPVRAVTFDFWCTLFGDIPERSAKRRQIRIDAFVEATGAPIERVAAAHDAVADAFHRHHVDKQQTLGPADALHIMCTHCNVEVDPSTAAELEQCFAEAILHHSPEPLEGALDAVRAAAERIPVGIVSDAGLSPGSSLRALLDRHGFTPYFTHLAFSNEVGVAKPQAPMFETAAHGLGGTTQDLLHIGDLEPTDIAGALNVQARAALFTGYHAKYKPGTKAHHVIEHWKEFQNELKSLLHP